MAGMMLIGVRSDGSHLRREQAARYPRQREHLMVVPATGLSTTLAEPRPPAITSFSTCFQLVGQLKEQRWTKSC
jgi:hypothetical protein